MALVRGHFDHAAVHRLGLTRIAAARRVGRGTAEQPVGQRAQPSLLLGVRLLRRVLGGGGRVLGKG